jgi:hypothetical protein
MTIRAREHVHPALLAGTALAFGASLTFMQWPRSCVSASRRRPASCPDRQGDDRRLPTIPDQHKGQLGGKGRAVDDTVGKPTSPSPRCGMFCRTSRWLSACWPGRLCDGAGEHRIQDAAHLSPRRQTTSRNANSTSIRISWAPADELAAGHPFASGPATRASRRSPPSARTAPSATR